MVNIGGAKVNMRKLQMFQKVEYGGGPIFKVGGEKFFWNLSMFSWVEFRSRILDLGIFSDFCTFFEWQKSNLY